MLFSELYSAYYNAVAQILTEALEGDITEKRMHQIVRECAFSESAMTIVPALKSGKWQLLDENLVPVVLRKPTMPVTLLEKRWLKALADDPRLQLFDVQLPDLDGVQPLFTRDDYRVYDQYNDGDPFEDERYIRNFRVLLQAIRENKPVEISLINRNKKEQWLRFIPQKLEYSLKDDKIRVIVTGSRYRFFNLAKIMECRFYEGGGAWYLQPPEDEWRELTLRITDNRNALERALLHFAEFEKRAEELGDRQYLLRLWYYASDETELLIRVLSFGPHVQVEGPQSFVDLVKRRLLLQKRCQLK